MPYLRVLIAGLGETVIGIVMPLKGFLLKGD